MKKKTVADQLRYSDRYLQKINKLYQKYSNTNRKFLNDNFGINISDIYLDQKNLTKILTQEIEKCHYHFSPPNEKKIVVGSKARLISNYPLLDRMMLSILYDLLADKTFKLLSPHVYSYIQGRSARQAVCQVADFFRQVRTADKKINVYVLRADITAYSDSIPIDSNSIVWEYLNIALEDIQTVETRAYIRSLVEDALRPILTNDEGLSFQKIVGIPTGSPLSTLVCNLYLRDLDNALATIPGAFYSRYGDDFVFAHTEVNKFKEGDRHITSILEKLRLKRNPEKEQRFYLTRAGKSLLGSTEFIGSNKIDFLGFVIFADGTMTLKPKTIKNVLKRIKQRVTNVAKMLTHLDVEARGETLCQIINQLLDVGNPFVDPGIKRLLISTNNRSSLRQIDYAIALAIAELLSGKKSVRAFQEISYATIRGGWKLISLCQQRSILRGNEETGQRKQA